MRDKNFILLATTYVAALIVSTLMVDGMVDNRIISSCVVLLGIPMFFGLHRLISTVGNLDIEEIKNKSSLDKDTASSIIISLFFMIPMVVGVFTVLPTLIAFIYFLLMVLINIAFLYVVYLYVSNKKETSNEECEDEVCDKTNNENLENIREMIFEFEKDYEK